MAHARTVTRRQLASFPMLLLFATLITIAPLRPAHAYIDPNSAGAVYQFLFPLLIAAASALTALRRHIARLWNRLIDTVVTAVRGERPPSHSDRER